MCQIAGVSRSGFYSYMKNRNDKDSHLNRKEEQDKRDFDLILEAYSYKGYDKGSRGIRMRLLHMGIRMNRKPRWELELRMMTWIWLPIC